MSSNFLNNFPDRLFAKKGYVSWNDLSASLKNKLVGMNGGNNLTLEQISLDYGDSTLTTFQIKRGLRAQITSLLEGEMAYATDTQEFLIGSNNAIINLNDSTRIDVSINADGKWVINSTVTQYIAKGDKGDQGIQGVQGIQGLKGDKGDQGIQGLKGDKGDKGDQGVTGAAGADGFTPTIAVKTDTEDTYILTITNNSGAIDTPNLKGASSTSGSSDSSTGLYKNKKFLILGDDLSAISEEDIAWDRCWIKYFNNIVVPTKTVNLSVGGATWKSFEDTVYDGNPILNGDDYNTNNVLNNQIEKLCRGKDTSNSSYVLNEDYDFFDVIYILCGTNDGGSTIPTEEEIESQFYTEEMVPITDLALLDRTSWTGAMRYAVDTLRRLYPNATIILGTPLQKVGGFYGEISRKNTIIKNISRRLGAEVVDTMNCGVYDMSSPTGEPAGDFNDEINLSEQGAQKLGKYIARHFKMLYL